MMSEIEALETGKRALLCPHDRYIPHHWRGPRTLEMNQPIPIDWCEGGRLVCEDCDGTGHIDDPERRYPGDPCGSCEAMGSITYYEADARKLYLRGREEGSQRG